MSKFKEWAELAHVRFITVIARHEVFLWALMTLLFSLALPLTLVALKGRFPWAASLAAVLVYGGLQALLLIILVHREMALRRSNRFVRLYEGLRIYSQSAIEPLKEAVTELKGRVEAVPPQASPEPGLFGEERPLYTKERNVMLAMIGVLCKQQGIDLSRPAKAAAILKSVSDLQGVRIGESTWEDKLKLVPDATASRSK